MEAKQAWGTFSIIIILVDAVFTSLMIDWGYEPVLVGAVALIILLVYFYVLYKRYHVEVVPESDIAQFRDQDDLRILCSIYGLDTKGNEDQLGQRLSAFAYAQGDKAFIWVAPKLVQSFGSALEIPQNRTKRGSGPPRSILNNLSEPSAKELGISRCPVCNAQAPREGSLCKQCGTNLAFYNALKESKVGKRVVSEKGGDVRHKHRYQVPSLREDR